MLIRLRPLAPDDKNFFEGTVIDCGKAMHFLQNYDPEMNWLDYLARVDETSKGISLPPMHVPSTFLVAVNQNNEIVGRVSIRHHLNDRLHNLGGHIGYAVVPTHRRKGYATTILKQALTIARSLGIEDVLLTCDPDNIGSKKVIKKCGGEPTHKGETHLRYWIRKR